MMLDFLFVIILTIIFMWAVPKKKDDGVVGDSIGSFFVCLLMYGLCKAPILLWYGNGIVPEAKEPIHIWAGTVAFVVVGGLWGLAGYCKRNNTNVQTLLGFRK